MRFINIITVLLLLVMTFSVSAQNGNGGVMVVFAEDANIDIPYKFVKNKEQGVEDSIPMKFLTIKYQFYNLFTQRLASSGYQPIGSVSANNYGRIYSKEKWKLKDSINRKKNKGKKYFSTVMDSATKSYYTGFMSVDTAQYLIIINKIKIHSSLYRRLFTLDKYMMDVHFDVYDKNMNHICGRYLRKYLRANRSTYWGSFIHQFSALPEELGLYFINLKK
ncbi:MAG TPA: hypothetical protein VEC12_11020 [Bacteroidia bacterium]|nr:hypothetical protein [Bacteroidia bacterium]